MGSKKFYILYLYEFVARWVLGHEQAKQPLDLLGKSSQDKRAGIKSAQRRALHPGILWRENNTISLFAKQNIVVTIEKKTRCNLCSKSFNSTCPFYGDNGKVFYSLHHCGCTQ